MIRLFSILMVVVAFCGSNRAFAAEDNFRFNSTGDVKPESDQVLKFKDEADKSSDDATDVTAIEYPKKELGLTIDMMGFNFRDEITFKQVYTYVGSGTVPTGFSLTYKWDDSLASYRGFTGRYYRIQVPASFDGKGQNILVASSAAELYNFHFIDSLGCSVGDTAFKKICLGYQDGVESFPAMDYPLSGRTDELRLTALKDFTGGLHISTLYPFIGRSTWNTNFSGTFGVGILQDANFAIKAAQRYNALIGAEMPAWGMFFNANLEAIYHNVEIKSGLPAVRVTNKNQLTSYNASVGFRWEWGSKKLY